MHGYVEFETKGNALKFYKNIPRLTKVFMTEADSCETQRGNLVADAQNILNLWWNTSTAC